MFQLIVAVISIALVAALAIASIYYGGAAFQKSSLKANVTTLVNGGQQISGADALYKTDNSGVGAAAIADLNPEYLSALPGLSGAADVSQAWDLALVDLNATATPATTDDTRVAAVEVNTAGTAEICGEVAKQAAETWTDGQLKFDGQFGCFESGTGTVYFGFKL